MELISSQNISRCWNTEIRDQMRFVFHVMSFHSIKTNCLSKLRIVRNKSVDRARVCERILLLSPKSISANIVGAQATYTLFRCIYVTRLWRCRRYGFLSFLWQCFASRIATFLWCSRVSLKTNPCFTPFHLFRASFVIFMSDMSQLMGWLHWQLCFLFRSNR